MCGFLGQAGQAKVQESVLIKGLAEIEHRGPNETKYQIEKNWSLGFNRLSILDLSNLGSQPMSNQKNDTIISFNGEIYNFLDLKRDLESAGYDLKGNSDTEVLLNYYHYLNRDIEKLLNKCNGMFAFSIIDKKKKSLIIARDRLGVKPLFFANMENSSIYKGPVHLASELGA